MKKIQSKPKIKKTVVVFVCTGNTCRSPVAERILKRDLKAAGKSASYRVFSVGLSASMGDSMSPLSAAVLKKEKVPFQNFKSKPLTEKIYRAADFFICMTEHHKLSMRGLKHPHIYSVKEVCGADVSDPYGGTEEQYQKMFDYLVYAMPEILKFIEEKIASKERI